MTARSLGYLGLQKMGQMVFTPRHLSRHQSHHKVCAQQDCGVHTVCLKSFMRLPITQRHISRACGWSMSEKSSQVFLTQEHKITVNVLEP